LRIKRACSGKEGFKHPDACLLLACSELYQKYAKDFFEGPVGSKVREGAGAVTWLPLWC